MRLENYNTTGVFPCLALPRINDMDVTKLPLKCLIYVSPLPLTCVYVCARAREI